MTRSERLTIRFTPEEREKLQAIADSKHINISTLLRSEILTLVDSYDSNNTEK